MGNPGREHSGTRHNVGFMVAEALVARWGLGRARDRFRGRLVEGGVPARAVLAAAEPAAGGPAAALGAPAATRTRVAVLCPQTYYNDAGRSVGPARGSYRLPLERVLVVHDEIDLPFADVRARRGGGLAGNNGLKSIKRELGGADFVRVRVGVGRPSSTDPEIVAAYVLGRFREGSDQVRELVERACGLVEDSVLAQDGAERDGTS